jgi:hypothetical protein
MLIGWLRRVCPCSASVNVTQFDSLTRSFSFFCWAETGLDREATDPLIVLLETVAGYTEDINHLDPFMVRTYVATSLLPPPGSNSPIL